MATRHGTRVIENIDHFGFGSAKCGVSLLTIVVSLLTIVFTTFVQPACPLRSRKHESQIYGVRARAVHTGPWPITAEALALGSTRTFAALPAPWSGTSSQPQAARRARWAAEVGG